MLALTVADNLQVSRVPRIVLLVAAFVLGTILGSVAIMTSGNYWDWPPAWGLVWGGLVALVYFKRRRDEELANALQVAQLTRVELQKKTLESHLQLVQAQVEPQFLFNTLQRVGDLYETDRASADQMLDNLILYLRAALPQMRTSTSTLGQEVQLARSYLNIERVSAHDGLDSAFDIPNPLGSAVFPPMVLLPLIDAFAPRGRNLAGEGEILHATARADAGVLRLTLTGTHLLDDHPATDEIESIRGRLTALFGADGKLEFELLNPHGAVATVELPHVPT
jgi:LytS/YehU family sensor histidine kinase